jgi:predicted CopG family antitoxin
MVWTVKIIRDPRRLLKHGNTNDSFDDVINRLIDDYEKTQKPRMSE